MKNRLERVRYRLNQCRLKLELYHPSRVINEKKTKAGGFGGRLTRVMSKRLEAYPPPPGPGFGEASGIVPSAQLGRGYSFVTGRDGKGWIL